MTAALFLPDFGAAAAPPAAPPAAAPEFDPAFAAESGAARDVPPTAEAEAYERGYRAGWEDQAAEAASAGHRLSAELARNLQDLAFTYHEARSHVAAAVEPLLRALVGRVLPQLVSETLGEAVLAELLALAETAAETPVTILVSPESHDQVAALLSAGTTLPYRLRPEPELGAWQVFFRLGERETLLDLDGLMARISARLAAFSDRMHKELRHG